jgi:outer membrane protein assembly factor BamB
MYTRLVCLLAIVSVASMTAQVSVTTYHNDNSRTGQNTLETTLTPGNVSASGFDRLFSQTVDGYLYAQPLYVPGVSIAGVSHNVVYVATEHDSVYAFDADSGSSVLWKTSLIPAGGSTVSSSSDIKCGDLVPEIGITGTPVIDLNSGTLYVVSTTKENGGFVQRLHALDITNGTEKLGGPVVIQASVAGSGDGSSLGKVSFDALHENQRAGLLLQNGLVYIGWASHCDISPYHGWVMAYSATSLAQVAVLNATPNGTTGGIWGRIRIGR